MTRLKQERSDPRRPRQRKILVGPIAKTLITVTFVSAAVVAVIQHESRKMTTEIQAQLDRSADRIIQQLGDELENLDLKINGMLEEEPPPKKIAPDQALVQDILRRIPDPDDTWHLDTADEIVAKALEVLSTELVSLEPSSIIEILYVASPESAEDLWDLSEKDLIEKASQLLSPQVEEAARKQKAELEKQRFLNEPEAPANAFD